MENNELINISSNEIESKNIKILDMYKVDNFLFIKLDNNQNILTNGTDVYDVSAYNKLSNMFKMNGRLCAVFTNFYMTYVVDLDTMEVLYEDDKAYSIHKQDDRTLHIIMKIGVENDIQIYDIKNKKYLPTPDGYEFEHSYENNLYIFRKKDNENDFYNLKRCVMNADGKMILQDVEGWIEIFDNFIITNKPDEISIIKVNKDNSISMNSVKQTDEMLDKPDYNHGNIVTIVKGKINIYNLDLKLIKTFAVPELEEVVDYEIINNVLKICVPYTSNGKRINKHIFINLKNGKVLSHIRIECYPYWIPTSYIGQDSIGDEVKEFHFYNSNFDKIISERANSYKNVDSNKENMFMLTRYNNNEENNKLLNTENGKVMDANYDYIHFHIEEPYGYGVNLSNQTMDFFDEDLNIIISNFEYENYGINYHYENFGYFIVNGYICIIKHYVGNYGQDIYKRILLDKNGDTILNSTRCECYKLGNFIQIIENDESKFLNTITGEIGPLSINAKVNEDGKINFDKLTNITDILTVGINDKIEPTEGSQTPMIKKLTYDEKRDD